MFKSFKRVEIMSGLASMKQRLKYAGGNSDGRNVKGKLKSMKAALWNSYQGEWITIDNRESKYPFRCLINPEKLTVDYNQKIISIEYEAGLKPGDTFLWNRTGKHFIVYTQFDEEEAYFRARIRQCDYYIEIDGEKYWTWVRGPVETALVWRQKHNIELNDMNYSIELFVTSNEITREFFSRHNVIKFDGHNWRVAATDKYSQEGVIEVYLEEFFDNGMLDEMIPPEIEKHEPDEVLPYIDGPQLVNVYDTDLTYSVVNYESAVEFVVNSNKAKIVSQDESSCIIEILTGKARTFTIECHSVDGLYNDTLEVKVQSF